VKRLPLSCLATEAFVCVLDQQVTDREASPLGLSGEPLCQLGRENDRATNAVVALPTSSGVSDKLSPLGRNPPRRLLKWNVAAQDAVAQKAQTAEIREAGPLG
jgi:hypothetical protein